MAGSVRGCILGAALLASTAVAAQEPAETGETEGIVVTGNRESKRQVREFIGALTDAPVQGQLSRFEFKVCPAAFGLTPVQNQAVVRRMRVVAQGAEMPVASPECTPNVVVVVTDDKASFIEALAEDKPSYFGRMSRGAIRRLAQDPGPAAAWQIEGLLSANGAEIPLDSDEGVFTENVPALSRIVASAHPHFTAAVVVVERKALTGLTPMQLADYAAMRTFARSDPARLPASAPPTILTVLAAPLGSEVPASLTRWDLGFLRALYASSEGRYAVAQRREMRRHLKKELEGPEEEKD